MFLSILAQTIQLSFRKDWGALKTCAFYIIAVMVFTFALGASAMAQYATAIMCVSMLFATITTLPIMFERDYEDGTLEQLILQPAPLEVLVLAKIMGHWCSHIIPILLVSPMLAIMAGMNFEQELAMLLVLLLTSPIMVAIGAISAALTIGNKNGGLLQTLVIMPFYIPVLIFATANEHSSMEFLIVMFCIILPIACYSCAALIKISVD